MKGWFCVWVFFFSIPAVCQHVRLNEVIVHDKSLLTLEVYNPEKECARLNDYYVSIEGTSTRIALLDSIVMPFSFVVVDISTLFPISHRTLSLRSKSTGEVLDEINLASWPATQFAGRIPDGLGLWAKLQRSSPGDFNSLSYSESLTDTSHTWENLVSDARFGNRDGAGSVVFSDSLWLLGGWRHGPLGSDVWKSKNGIDWEFVTDAPWPGRHQAGFCVFDGKIWVIGGDLHTDVWNSADGRNWDLVTDTAPWGERYAPYVVAFNGKIWLMGGQTWNRDENGKLDFNRPIGFNDVWCSSNGVDWTQATAAAPWGARSMINGSIVHNNKMWILGGGIKKDSTTFAEYNDVWNSEDGILWNKIAGASAWSPRIHFSTTVFNGRIWITDGSPGSPKNLSNEVWSSEDGVTWSQLTATEIWRPRHASSLVSYDGSLWVIAGFNSSDVWRYTEPRSVFYSKSAGPLNDLNSWTSLPDGKGNCPASFDDPHQTFFYLRAKDSFDDSLRITGKDSKLVVGNGVTSSKLILSGHAQIDGMLEVHRHSSLIVESSQLPLLHRLYEDSEVIYAADKPSMIKSASYHNLTIRNDVPYVTENRVIVHGTLSVNSSPLTTGGNEIALFGDLAHSGKHNLQDAHLRLLGQDHQILSGADTLMLNDLSVNKSSGSVMLNQNVVGVNSLKIGKGELSMQKTALKVANIFLIGRETAITLGVRSELQFPVSSGTTLLLPARLDAVDFPLLLKTGPDEAQVRVAPRATEGIDDPEIRNRERLLTYGWEIATTAALEVGVMWTSEMEPAEFNSDSVEVAMFGSVASVLETKTAVVRQQDNGNNLSMRTFDVAAGTNGIVTVGDFKVDQDLFFKQDDSLFYGGSTSFHIRCGSGAPVTIESLDPMIAFAQGGLLYATGVGSARFHLVVKGDNNFLSKDSIITVHVGRASQSISFSLPGILKLSEEIYPLMPTSTSGLPIEFRSSDNGIAEPVLENLHVNTPGEVTITAHQAGNEFYRPASLTRDVEIEYPAFLEVFPNPAITSVKIAIPLLSDGQATLRILDRTGKELKQWEIHSTSLLEIDVRGFGQGIFIFRLASRDFNIEKKVAIISE